MSDIARVVRGSRFRLAWLLLATASAAALTNYLLEPNRRPMAGGWRFGLFVAAWLTVVLAWRRHQPHLRRWSGGLTLVVAIGEILVVSAVRNLFAPYSPIAASAPSASPALFRLTEAQAQQAHALMQAVQRNDVAYAQVILSVDDRPDALDCGSEGDCTIETPLHLAVAKGEHQIAALLLARGASVTQGDPNLLLEATNNNDVPMMRLLIQHGAPVNDDDTKANSTALWDAVLRGNLNAVDCLLQAGANPATHGPDPTDYKTPIYAIETPWSVLRLARFRFNDYNGNPDLVNHLRRAGAPE